MIYAVVWLLEDSKHTPIAPIMGPGVPSYRVPDARAWLLGISSGTLLEVHDKD